MTPPTLPGEVWRGDVDGPVCVTVRESAAEAWWWDADDEEWWSSTTAAQTCDIIGAWALSLRAERDATMVLLSKTWRTLWQGDVACPAGLAIAVEGALTAAGLPTPGDKP